MRSTFFQQTIEFKIEVEGETWNQGDVINGELKIRNLGNETVFLNAIHLILAHGLKKAIKEKSDIAWETSEKLILNKDISLPSNKEELFKWSINLKTDCPITDKLGGLFLLFGGDDVMSVGGRLDLQVNLHPILQNFLQTFTTQFRFLEKYQKRKFDWTEVKLIPPESREFPNMESVSCLLRVCDERLEVNYSFKMQGLGRSGEQMKVTKRKREFKQTILKKNYLQHGGFPNRSCFKENINQALNIARPDVIL